MVMATSVDGFKKGLDKFMEYHLLLLWWLDTTRQEYVQYAIEYQ